MVQLKFVKTQSKRWKNSRLNTATNGNKRKKIIERMCPEIYGRRNVSIITKLLLGSLLTSYFSIEMLQNMTLKSN